MARRSRVDAPPPLARPCLVPVLLPVFGAAARTRIVLRPASLRMQPRRRSRPIRKLIKQDDGKLQVQPQIHTTGTPWTEEEHRMFLMGLQKLGKGDWRGISRNFVVSRTPTQVASHAQKYFIRQTNSSRRKRRSSLFDMVPEMPMDESPAATEQFPLQNNQDEATSSNQLPSLQVGLQKEAEFAQQWPTLQSWQYEESEFSVPSKTIPADSEMNPSQFKNITAPTMPAFYPAFVPVPLTHWPPNIPNVEDVGTTHEILRPTPLKGKEVVKAYNVAGMSKLSIGDTSSGSMEPTALSLQLIGSMDTRQSAFHVSPPRTRPDLSKRNCSPIHAV